MAINLRKFNNKLENFNDTKKISAIILSLIMIISIGLCMMYPKIERMSKEPVDGYFERSDFIDYIFKANYVLYNKFNSNELIKGDSNSKEVSEFIDYKFPSWVESLENIPNLWSAGKEKNSSDVEVINDYKKDSEGYKIKYDDGTKEILFNYETLTNINKNKYRFYCILEFDDKGNMNIKDLYGAENEMFKNMFFTVNDQMMRDNNYLEPIKNMRVAYAVPKEMIFSDDLYYSSNYSTDISDNSFVYVNTAFIIIILIGIFIPYKLSKKIIGFNMFKKISFETFIVFIILSLVMIINFPMLLINETINKDYIYLLDDLISNRTICNYIIYFINILCWFVCFTSIIYEITYIKYICKEGRKRYFKENILVFNIVRKFRDKIENIDLKGKNNKKILIAVLINLIITGSVERMWYNGLIGGDDFLIILVIYTIILFIILKRFEKKIKSNYKRLLKQTHEMSNGNLDFKVNEDLGMFNELKDELQKIQGGFKKAVDEEVKSQNMKTELISNVSHDLKTPLTSIISYVDLLKSEKDEEKKKQYIETLDKKSQRLKALIEDLFEMSKASSGNINLNIIEVDIISLIKQTMIELNDKIEESTIKFKFNHSEEKIILPLDSQRTFRVFENLILNITKYSMKNSRAYIDVIKREGKVQITLRNISENELNFGENEIVERFVRGDKSRNTEGSGLGLAIAKSFVELQGGTFNISLDGDLFKVVIVFKVD